MPGIGQFSISDWRKLLTILRDPWTDFTPTLVQGVAVTLTVTHARYRSIGKTVIVQARLAITGSGTAGSLIALGNLPVPARSSGNVEDACGVAIYTVAAGTIYALAALMADTTTVRFINSGGTSYFGINPGVTLTNGHTMGIQLTYEAA